ncbi:MAG: hypothetical protein SPI14_00615 [Arcanobacterium sp.]|nr:hypothetical protein [Arcanobacterium sp.]
MSIGIEGIALAVGVFLFFAYAIPAFAKRRIVIDATPIDERYAENLRLIPAQSHTPRRSNDHGRIFVMNGQQRIPSRQERKSGRTPEEFDVRAALRARARAHRRMVSRRDLFARFLLVDAVIALAAIGLWIAAGFGSLALVWPIVATSALLIGGLGLGYATYIWKKADVADAARMARIETKLKQAGYLPRCVRTAEAASSYTRESRAIRDAYRPRRAGASPLAQASRGKADERSEITARVEHRADAATQEAVRLSTKEARARASASRPDASRADDAVAATQSRGARGETSHSEVSAKRAGDREVGKAPSLEAPSYTIKSDAGETFVRSVRIRKRSVKESEGVRAARSQHESTVVSPYPSQAGVSSPYRPKALGETIGELPDANPAPEMTGNEEVRNDVLGGGSMLDALLERRRA